MFDFDPMEFARRLTYRYGTRVDPTDLDNGTFGLQEPTPETSSRDYFRENSPSASRRGSNYEPYQQQPYFAGEEAAAADGITLFAVLLVVACVSLIAAYFFLPSFHTLIDSLLHH